MKVDDLISLQGKLAENQTLWTHIWDSVCMYVLPDVKDIWKTSKGANSAVRPECLDSTAQAANLLLASSMHMSFTSDASEWFRVRVRDSKLMQSMAVREYCQEVTRRIYDACAMSNFYQTMFTGWLTLPAFGTSAMFIEDRNNDGILRTRAIPIYNVFPVENWDGLVDTVFVKDRFSLYKIVQRWPSAKELSSIKQDYEQNPFKELEVLHYVGPAEGWPLADKENRYVSIYILNGDSKDVLNKIGDGYEGYQEFPYLVDRWNVLPGEVFGVGPGVYILPTILSLMKTTEIKYEALGMVVNPPVASTEDNIQAIGENGKIGPGVQIIMRDLNNSKPWITGANIPIAELSEEKLRDQINKMWFVNELMLAPDRPEMTAYETAKRVELVHRLLGPVSNRVQRERLNPAIERIFGILQRAKNLPDLPDELVSALKSDKDVMDIEYVSPLARAQRYNEVQSAQELLSHVVQAAQYDPIYLQKINFSEYVDFIAERTGVPVKVLTDSKEFEQIMAARAEQEKQNEQLTQLETAGGAAQRFSRAAQGMAKAGVM